MSNLVQKKQSKKYPDLTVHKYHKKVFYKNLWKNSEELLESRGHVYDSEGNLVINPFTKIFNYGENGTTIEDDEKCVVVEKINGFMACATNIRGKGVIVSTTGSLDSPHVDMAKEMMPFVLESLELNGPGATYIFEIVHPDDPHIIQENVGVYLLGVRHVSNTGSYFSWESNEILLDRTAKVLRVSRPFWWNNISFKRAKQYVQASRMEGYVVYGQQSRTVLKLKSPYYLTKKMAARREDITTLQKERVDEEYYPLIEHLKTIKDKFNQMDEQERLRYMERWINGNMVY